MDGEQIMVQQSGQTVTPDALPSDSGQEAQNQANQQYVTSEQLEELEKRILSQAQSLVDKKGNAINAKIEQLKAAGITATPEQARALVEREEQQVQSSDHPQEAAQPNAGAGQVDQEQAEWIVASTGNAEAANDPAWQSVYQISKMNDGMLIESTDPEFEIMNKQFDSGTAFVSAFAQAIAQKKLRMKDGEQSNVSYASTPAAFSSGQKSNITPQDTPYGDLYTRAYANK